MPKKFRLVSYENRPSASPDDILVEVTEVNLDVNGSATVRTDFKDIIGYFVFRKASVSNGQISVDNDPAPASSKAVVVVLGYANRETL